ncbi:MAG: GNAT family N-acetyltransferase [Actinomycetota bacterium]|nr:GNAT family N-acetyltransferase [Actinomycetota bacterium]
MNTPSLPYGLTARALRMDDARAVFEVAALQEEHDLGKIEIEAADIVADWQRPSFDVGSQTIGVFDGETMVGYGEITGHDRGDAAVHPSYRRRGLGSTIARWMQDCARGRGSTVLGTPVPRFPKALPPTGSSQSWATGCAGRAGSWRCPRAGRSRSGRFPTATRSGRQSQPSIPLCKMSKRTRS